MPGAGSQSHCCEPLLQSTPSPDDVLRLWELDFGPVSIAFRDVQVVDCAVLLLVLELVGWDGSSPATRVQRS